MTKPELKRELFYGDNLDVLRKKIKDESVDLCYIDPPFNSKRNYFQIYNNLGKEDLAQAQAFIDTWSWSSDHTMKAYQELKCGYEGRFTAKVIDLIDGLHKVLGEGSLLAYLVNMTVRIAEIHRVLKPTGSFYLHCDPTASHYLKIILDAIFCAQGGDFKNEIIWIRSNPKSNISVNFSNCTDTILRYTKSGKYIFNQPYGEHNEDYVSSAYKYSDEKGRYRLLPLLNPNDNRPNLTYEFLGVTRVWRWTKERMQKSYNEGLVVQLKPGSVPQYKKYLSDSKGRTITNHWSDIPQAAGNESLGYPTQKPEALMERIIKASSSEGDIVLDAFCGCGTTVVVAERLNREWIGIDITYQSISLVLKRLKDSFPNKNVIKNIQLNGIPKDMESAIALANKEDDRVRKEFEKWAVLTYTDNYSIFGIHLGQNRDGKQGRLGILLSLTVVKSAVRNY
jgi:site-specific DNA-methyltransferase (adenine-specific)